MSQETLKLACIFVPPIYIAALQRERREKERERKRQDTVRLRANYVNGRKGTFSYILDRLHALNARRKCAPQAAGRINVTGGSTYGDSHDVASSSSRLVTRKGAITRAQRMRGHAFHMQTYAAAMR